LASLRLPSLGSINGIWMVIDGNWTVY